MPPVDPDPHTPAQRPAASASHRDIRVLVKVLQPGSAARRARTVVREVLREAGVGDDAIIDAEIVVAELAANAERHGQRPYELRVFRIDGVPTWCEVVDGDPRPEKISDAFQRLATLPEPDLSLLAENGRGLLLTYELSQGHCQAYRTTTTTTDSPGKAVGFALPTASGPRTPTPPSPTSAPASPTSASGGSTTPPPAPESNAPYTQSCATG
ncbi:ATP-binding protein [Sphaerisporangium rhizosphaerae]|uniref:ATP-binding protein n=1 Tax=Sphaerisporangium rhizosphaerae TaxID=2269375 RepID=A0ABW2NWP1_9ACTN